MLHRRPAQSVNRKAGSSPSHLACPATTVRRLTAPCRKVHAAAAAAATGADAETVEPADQAPAAEAAAAAADQPASTATSSSSSPLGERSTTIRISSRTDATKTAAYIVATLAELGPSTVLRVSAVGPGAMLAALKTLARAGELTAERAPGKVLTLEPRHRMLRAMQPPAGSSSSGSGSGSGSAQGFEDQQQQQQQAGTLSTQEWFVRQEPAELFSTEQPEDAPPLNPMRIRADTDYSKVAEHACRLARRAPKDATHAVAAFGLYPGREFMQRAKVLVSGLATARQQLLKDGHPGFTMTLQRTLVEVQRRVQQQDGAEDAGQQEQQQQQQGKDGSSSSDAGATETQLRPSFVVRLYPTPARANANGAARRGAGGYRRSSDGDGRSSSSSSSSSSGRRRSARPGFVEVPAAEWAALREQLEVVPGLTQQLQTMTRQHEQLLGLLAAQQQQQGGGEGQAAAAAAAPEAVQQQQV
uniref:Uncharacterized protein n=1 Tax=Tetradesmus obliquus TaxID=3088 RepID=A0A383W6U3_TETOB|eukprot:jgi/Sobl393_1/9020/SZX72416.1